jgi:hypothetical protein
MAFQTLEQLVNSNSVASSIKQPFLLRRFNWITVALLILWGLSPLATQAMQRISDTNPTNNYTTVGLRYVDTGANNANYLSADSAVFDTVEAEFNRLYPASFLPTYGGYGSDSYGNALIPLLDDNAFTDPSGWQNADPGEDPLYASSYGVPIALISDYSNTSLYDDFTSDSTYSVTIPAAYLDFSCSPLQIITDDDLVNITDPALTSGESEEITLYLGMTPMNAQTNGTLALASLITLNTTDPNQSTNVDVNQNATYAYTKCSFSQTFVYANITCESSQCYTSALKRKPAAAFVNSGSDNWVSGLLGTSGYTNDSKPTATDTERYLMSRGNIGSSNPRMNLTTVDLSSFTTNLAFLMNTFWSIGFAPTNLTAVLINSATREFNPGLNTKLSLIPASKIDEHDVFQTNWGWLAALMLCSVFLLLAGIFSIWWDARTVSPDVLGFASSVVRKSKYVQLPSVDNAASGAERVRALGDVRVMMQDVKPLAPVGRIALGTAHPNAKRLEPGRSYR